MLFHTHLMFGLFLILVFLPYVGSPWVFVPVVLIASVLPDIDTPTSKVGKNLLLRPMQWCVKHRGFFHSLLACGLFTLLLWGWGRPLGVGFFIGYLGHLFMDSLTKEGVPLLWPSDIKAGGWLKTGGYGDAIVFGILAVVDAALYLRIVA